jgi:hypothetical protein
MAKQTKKRFRTSKRSSKKTNAKSRKNFMRGGYRGTMDYMNGTYTGQIWNKKPHGNGNIKLCDGSSYHGEWINGKMFGRGLKIYPNNTIYDGRWKNNKRHGFGTMYYNDDKVAKGNWESDNPIGQFKMIWPVKVRNKILPSDIIIDADELDDFEIDNFLSEADTDVGDYFNDNGYDDDDDEGHFDYHFGDDHVYDYDEEMRLSGRGFA